MKRFFAGLWRWIKAQFTFTKIAIAVILYKSIGWVDQSYALAWAGKDDIAEALSKVVVTEVIAVFLTYAAKALFESLSKNNIWPDKTTNKTDGSGNSSGRDL
jgi:hypothetical protein